MVEKLLFAGALSMCVMLSANADTVVFTSEDLGDVNGISDNGKYAAIADVENNIAYLWSVETNDMVDISMPRGDADTPAGQCVVGTVANGVADDGTVVGAVIYADGRRYPAIYKDGEWRHLPLHPAAMNSNEAVAITGDGSVIGGFQFIMDETSDIAGRYYPVRWERGADGEYTLEAYTDIELPDHQGFYPRCMNADGSILAGTLYAGADSTLPAYVKDGELYYNAKIEEIEEPLIYKGQYYCGYDEEGVQIWTDDPNDPRIVYYPATLIDGVRDEGGDTSFQGAFSFIDNYNNIYGQRSIATDVDTEEHTGTVTSYATMYNVANGEWTDYSRDIQVVYAGVDGGKYLFTGGDNMLVDGKKESLTQTFGFQTDNDIAGINKMNRDASVLGGMLYEINPVSGEPQYYPLILVLDKPLADMSGIMDVAVSGGQAVAITVDGGNVEVSGAESVAIYDMQGRKVSGSASSQLNSGLYVVKADKVVRKIMVK